MLEFCLAESMRKLQFTFWSFVMRKSTFFLLLSFITFLLIQFPVAATSATADEEAANEAFLKAQETIAELEKGIERAEEFLLKINEQWTEIEYQIAEQIKKNAELMLAEALKHESDSSGISENLSRASTDAVATAVAYATRAQADTSQSYSKLGLLLLRAMQFAVDDDLDCAEEAYNALMAKDEAWRILQNVVALADLALEHANSALTPKETAENDAAELSAEAAKEAIALARELDLHLENFEYECVEAEEIQPGYEDIEDLEDDRRNVSPF